MSIQNMWPAAFLALIPVIILFYILRQKAEDRLFSSDMLWKELYRNLEAKTPFEKLKHQLLMYMQILILLLLILALAAPVLNTGGHVSRNLVLVMDTSGSMLYQYDDTGTRLDYSIREAEEAVSRAGRNTVVTIISCAGEPSLVYQGSDRTTIKSRLHQLAAREEAGTLDAALPLIHSVISDMEHAEILCYTDTEFASGDLLKMLEKQEQSVDASFSVINAYSAGENCAVDAVSYAVDADGTTVLCNVTNYGTKDSEQELSLYADQQIVSVQPVQIPAGESTTVYFEPVRTASDGSTVIRAELSEQDALPQDNVQQAAVTAGRESRVLLISKGNVFLEKALGLNEGVSVYKTDSPAVMGQTDDVYDLYVFDGDVSDQDDKSAEKNADIVIPPGAALLFLDQSGDTEGMGGVRPSGQSENTVLSFLDTDVTRYVTGFSFGIAKTWLYQLPEWAQPLIKDADGGICGYYGYHAADDGHADTADASGHMTAVLGFDLHDSDLALQAEFPVFMSQLAQALLQKQTDAAEVTNFPTASESDVAEPEAVSSEGSGSPARTGKRSLRSLVLICVLVLLAAEWFVYIWQVHSSKKRQYLPVRLAVCLLVILAICGLSITLRQKKAQTIFLADVSDSMSGNIAVMEEYLRRTMERMPDKNSSAVVLFGKNTAVESFMSDRNAFSEFTARPVTTATNIETAVETACRMFDEGAAAQLVLLTDGSENEGNISLSAAAVKRQNVALSVIKMADSISAVDEVYVSDLSVPNVIHVGDHYNVTVSIASNVETDARLSLYAGRSLKGQKDIHLTIGTNQFVFEDTAEKETIAQYRAVVEAANDTAAVNNTYAAFAEIEAEPRILLVEGKNRQAKEFEKVLQAAGVQYDCITPSGVPVSVAQLTNYKAVITLDVYYDDLRKGFVKALETYVKDYSGGYICIGGENSYALGNYRGTVLEDILPVSMELQGEKEIPKMAMAMVIDQSGSMSAPAADDTSVTCLDLAKQAAVEGTKQLRETDEVGILAFDDAYHWYVPVRQADDPEAVASEVSSIAAEGGTSIYPALEAAYEALAESDAKLKHIILLTDGQDGFHDYEDLFEQINEAGITVSSVAVGEGADKDTLAWIASECGGRYYYTDMNNAAPRIFAQEVYLATDTYLVNEEFYPAVTSASEILSGVTDDGMPALFGYVATTPKQLSDIILTSPEGDPVLGTWQYGLGRTVAWTSDGTNEWTAGFAVWENYPQLWSNIISYVIADTSQGEDSLEVVRNGNGGNGAAIVYETKDYGPDTKVTAVVTDENGASKEITLHAERPGSFRADLDVSGTGVYSISVRRYAGEELVQSCNTAYASQYSVEYRFAEAGMDLSEYAAQCGGTVITLEDNVWNNNLRTVKNEVVLTVPLLILALFVWLADVALRRLSADIASGIAAAAGRVRGAALYLAAPFLRVCKKLSGVKKRAGAQQDQGGLSAGESAGMHWNAGHADHSADAQKQAGRQADQNTGRRKKSRKKAAGHTDAADEMLDMEQLLKKKRDREN